MKAYILSLNKDAHLDEQWDFGFVKDFLDGNLWQTTDWQGFDTNNVTSLPKEERAIVLIAARHHKGLEDKVNKELNKIKRVVLFLMGDEEADFDVTKITHKNIAIWVQNPHLDKHDDYDRIGTGYPQHMHKNLPSYTEKDIDVFFAGQITHQRRTELIDAINISDLENTVIIQTEGFTQGKSPKDYYSQLARAIVAPAPSGAVIPDSFRLFEALECMAIPIADQKTADGEEMEYWDWLFKQITPFPKLNNWFVIEETTNEQLNNYPHNIHKQTQWWIHWKRNFVYKVMEQLHE